MNSSRRNTVSRTLLIGAAACVSLIAAASPAEACGGEWIPVMNGVEVVPGVDYRPQGIDQAEKQMLNGKYLEAASTVIRVMPHVRQLDPKRAKIVERAQRVLALATARSEGTMALGALVPTYAQDDWQGDSAKTRQANLEWAVARLRDVSALHDDNPAAQTDLAEAMAYLDETKGEALALLEKLAKRDLLASPEAYAALAALRSDKGDGTGQELALTRCKAMAGDANVCGAGANEVSTS